MPQTPIEFPAADWTVAAPESQGLDSRKLQAAMDAVRAIAKEQGNSQALLVRGGRLLWRGGDNLFFAELAGVTLWDKALDRIEALTAKAEALDYDKLQALGLHPEQAAAMKARVAALREALPKMRRTGRVHIEDFDRAPSANAYTLDFLKRITRREWDALPHDFQDWVQAGYLVPQDSDEYSALAEKFCSGEVDNDETGRDREIEEEPEDEGGSSQ